MKLNDSPLKNDTIVHHLFADKYSYFGSYDLETDIVLTQFNADVLETIAVDVNCPSFKELIKEDHMNWIRICGLRNAEVITRLLKEFDIPEVDIKAILTPCHAAKIDDFNGRLIIVLRSCIFESKKMISTEHVCILTKDNVVISFKERDKPLFQNVVDCLESNTMGIRSQGAGMLIAFILNALFSIKIGTAIKVEEMLEKLDDVLLDVHHNSVGGAKRIQQCRHVNLILQKNSIPLHKEFNKLLKIPMVKENPLLPPIYNELYNQLDFVVSTSANSRELLASMRDLYTSSNDLRTGAVMKRLTVVSTLFIPITFLVGFWGMNFRIMPETEWEYGYFIAWGVLILTVVGTWKYMKKNKWF